MSKGNFPTKISEFCCERFEGLVECDRIDLGSEYFDIRAADFRMVIPDCSFCPACGHKYPESKDKRERVRLRV